MKTVILYYTFGGSTKKEAERLSAELGAPAHRVKEARSRSLLGSFIPGCPHAVHRKATPILPPSVDLRDFDRIVIGCPVWAGYPAPAFNSIVELLPAGKEVEIFLCSGGGDTGKSEAGTKEVIENKGCSVVSYRNVCTKSAPGKIKE
jgi:flavodoxin